MSRKTKKSKAFPVVLVITVLIAALAVCAWLVKPYFDSKKAADAKAAEKARLAEEQERADQDAELENKYQQELAEWNAEVERLKNPQDNPAPAADWPEHKKEGWDIVDLSDYPLKSPSAEQKTRAEVMNGGMLLINQWHSRPEDFIQTESQLVSVGKHVGGNDKVQVDNYNITLFPSAADALLEAVTAARAEGQDYYIVTEGYRSWDKQNEMFQEKKKKLASKYTSEEALIEATRKEVNYPGTSEFNSGLSFTLRLYKKDDPDINTAKYSTTAQAAWMNENCWKYGLVFRFPQAGWPLASTQDKSFKTGISLKMNLYRYVGKGNAAFMHYLDMCLEEYIEYLHAHPHLALFEDDTLKYEVYCQPVGEEDSFLVQLTQANSHVSSLDNMGYVITVFNYQ